MFGTDGIRGVANRDLSPELAMALGRAAARVLGRSQWVVGRDTRRSGPLLTAALSAGLASEGAGVTDLGTVPTPAAAFWSARLRWPAAMVSASHNPFSDNGIKLFGPGGRKLSDETESAIEAELRASDGGGRHPEDNERPVGEGIGAIDVAPDPLGPYVDHIVATLGGRRLEGLRLVVDCANGAATVVAPRVLSLLGAGVELCSSEPDGTNINAECGSTHPELLQRTVVATGADVGLAFDGDADRVLAVDHTGEVVDGDHVIAICAADRQARGLLVGDGVVITVMANLGLRRALDALGIRAVETPVGDRYVLEALEREDLVLGGEQSGHIVFRDIATTGDGLLTAVQLLDVVRRSGLRLASLASQAMTRFPQALLNVRASHRDRLETATEVWEAVARAETELGRSGRVVLRSSGTEPLVRVMVEAATQETAQNLAERLARVVATALD